MLCRTKFLLASGTPRHRVAAATVAASRRARDAVAGHGPGDVSVRSARRMSLRRAVHVHARRRVRHVRQGDPASDRPDAATAAPRGEGCSPSARLRVSVQGLTAHWPAWPQDALKNCNPGGRCTINRIGPMWDNFKSFLLVVIAVS